MERLYPEDDRNAIQKTLSLNSILGIKECMIREVRMKGAMLVKWMWTHYKNIKQQKMEATGLEPVTSRV